ncbi:MAG TPA: hypothetical protein VK123_00100 [Candidatus Limnocylindrales bacterium]|nr:hypothetical protein [Candidatus Limnocylindrales bacterium]
MERGLFIGSIAAITGFLIGGLSEYNFGDSEVVMVAWTIMALPWAAEDPKAWRVVRFPARLTGHTLLPSRLDESALDDFGYFSPGLASLLRDGRARSLR